VYLALEKKMNALLNAHRWLRYFAVAIVLSACGGGGSSSDNGGGGGGTGSVAAFVYVLDFNNGQGTMSGYSLDASSGALSLLAGSPFNNTGGGFAASVDRMNHVLYVTSTIVSSISPIPVSVTTGALPAPAGQYFTGAGPIAVTVDPGGRFVYTANEGDNDVSVFSIGGAAASNPVLTPVGGSPFPVGRTPYAIATDPSGNHVYVANRDDSTVSAFSLDAGTGALTEIPGSPFPLVSWDQLPVSLTVHPSGKYLLVGTAQDVTAYSIDAATGAIAAVDASAGAGSTTAGGGQGSIVVDPSGSYLYVASGQFLYGFGIDQATGYVQLLANGRTTNGGSFIQLTIDPSGKYLLVTDNSQNVTHSYKINAADGSLTPAPGNPFPLIPGSTTGQGPTSIVAVH
jgi:6-phosphogluconolactonase